MQRVESGTSASWTQAATLPCAHMFEEQECPSRFEYAPDLAQATLRIMHGTQDECNHRALEMRIGEWEGFDWGAP